MGEIKSTLEIIMEKTKHMTVSEDEKMEFKVREVRSRVRGMINKFFDGVIGLDKLKMEIATIEKEKQGMATQAFIIELIPLIKPGEDHTTILEILEIMNGIDATQVKALLDGFNKKLEDKRDERDKALEERVKERGISGSAVIPNLNADSEWINYLSDKGKELEDRLHTFSKQL
ncbi:hypothetical protein ACFL7M_19200 [Thermodesulfobacteriota bacterium]